jgi:NAD(P)-dependent dehydrogenase (short-subunit alcohol dehydrogenase family)
MKSVVVTGVSTGIGLGVARVLLAKGYRVFGSVRKAEDATRLLGEFGTRFMPLVFDVTNTGGVAAGAAVVSSTLGTATLAGLVNNAGIAVPGPLLHLPAEEFRRQLDVNVTGQLVVTQAFAPLLGADAKRQGPRGRIVMMSSVGGRNAMPFLGAYNASKFALEGLAEALRRELMLLGIDVIIVAPGAIDTPIWDKADAVDASPYADTPFYAPLLRMQRAALALGRSGLAAERVGLTVHRALTARKPHTRYVVTPDRTENFLVNTLPKRFIDRIVARRLGLMPGR